MDAAGSGGAGGVIACGQHPDFTTPAELAGMMILKVIGGEHQALWLPGADRASAFTVAIASRASWSGCDGIGVGSGVRCSPPRRPAARPAAGSPAPQPSARKAADRKMPQP